MSDTKTSKGNDKVTDKVTEARNKLNETRQRLSEVRTVLAEARRERDEAITNADKVHSESYEAGYQAQRDELKSLDEAYTAMRGEVIDRWSIESAALAESHDVAVAAANQAYDDVQEAAKRTFGES